ncbi:MAG: hypothetical protein K0R93_678 [Anaerosolibacter sp.]|jgi:hypothetical protein|uniref:DUF6709 family protein n=1 Tax=Anaerosolibacter sp. TaxID=1872527 RepID=UPI002632E260|nr:DUF6709 family protein [Anaerosolibacter sp.]MDF2545780.1 hypothetical protein [Anaerosolibacter sp.]
MKKEFIDLQVKRTRRNIIIFLALLILFTILITFKRGLGFMIGGILLFAFIMHPVRFVTSLKNFKMHSVNKAISVYGRFYEVEQKINNELLKENSVQYGNVIITDSWILKINTFSLDIINLADVVWVYNDVTLHEQGAIIPGAAIPAGEMGKTFAIIINSKNPIRPTTRISISHFSNMDDSKEAELAGIEKKQRMWNILGELQRRCPHAIFGYTKELDKMWKVDKNRFIEEVKLGAMR